MIYFYEFPFKVFCRITIFYTKATFVYMLKNKSFTELLSCHLAYSIGLLSYPLWSTFLHSVIKCFKVSSFSPQKWHLFTCSDINYLLNSHCITWPTPSDLLLYSFWATFTYSFLKCFKVASLLNLVFNVCFLLSHVIAFTYSVSNSFIFFLNKMFNQLFLFVFDCCSFDMFSIFFLS